MRQCKKKESPGSKRNSRCCVIVGAGAGLGLAIARRFAREGWHIALVSRNREKLDDLVEILTREGYSAKGFAADAGVQNDLEPAFEQIRQWPGQGTGHIGILIYNAAAMVSDNVLDLTPAKMADKMALNLGGAICSVNQVLPEMRRRKSGTILITGGGLGLEPYPDWASLSAGKAALRSYTIALHKALAPENIHAAVIAVCGIVEAGGPFDPDRVADVYWQVHAESRQDWRRERIYLPENADPYYNDVDGVYRTTSFPVRKT